MSVFARLTDSSRTSRHVRFVPLTDSCAAANGISNRQYWPKSKLALQVPEPKSDPSTAILQSYLKNRELQFRHRTSAQIAYIAPGVGQQPEHGCRCGRRWHPNWQIAGELLRVVRNSLLGPNGVSEWVWQAGASRETIGAGSRSRCPRRVAGDLLGGGRSRLDDHGRNHALQGLAAVNEDMAMTVMPLRACWHS